MILGVIIAQGVRYAVESTLEVSFDMDTAHFIHLSVRSFVDPVELVDTGG